MVKCMALVLALFAMAGFFWYGVWCFCHYVLDFDVVQSWLGVVGVLVAILWLIVRDKKVANDALVQTED